MTTDTDPLIILERLATEQEARGNYEIATHYRDALRVIKEELGIEE